MGNNTENIRGIACSIFKKEIEFLQKEKKLDIHFTYFDSMLHLDTEKLEHKLLDCINKGKDDSIILIYGDCCPSLFDYNLSGNIKRIAGINCIEIILGKVLYHKLRSEGAFFIMPEWAFRWREAFQRSLGLNDINCKSFMNEMHKNLIYINTGLIEIPYNKLDEISEFTGLPYTTRNVTLDTLLDTIKKIL